MNITRRGALLSASAIIPAALLAGCGLITSNTTNGVTTITINVADLDNWGNAIVNAASLLAPFVGPIGATILEVGTVAKADLTAADVAAGGSLSLSFNSTSAPAAVSSLLADGQKIVSTVGSAVTTGAVTQLVAEAQTYLTAAETIVSVFSAALGLASASLAVPKMTETAALAALGVHN
jgi:hypothetical protein